MRGVAEWRMPAQHLVQRDAEAELIGARVARLAPVLLGCHVQRRTEHVARHRHRYAQQARRIRRSRRCLPHLVLLLVHAAGEPEVGDLNATVVANQHVLRLEVAMHDADLVRGDQAAASRYEQLDDLAPAELVRVQPLAQRLTAHILHREEDVTFHAADVVDHDDVGVRQPRHCLCLTQQPRAALERVGTPAWADQLDRDRAIELGIVREVDHAHAAFGHRLADHIATETLAGLDYEARARLARTGFVHRRSCLAALPGRRHDSRPAFGVGIVAAVQGGIVPWSRARFRAYAIEPWPLSWRCLDRYLSCSVSTVVTVDEDRVGAGGQQLRSRRDGASAHIVAR